MEETKALWLQAEQWNALLNLTQILSNKIKHLYFYWQAWPLCCGPADGLAFKVPRHLHLMRLHVYGIHILFCSVVTNICKCSGGPPNGRWDAQHGALSSSRKRSAGRAKLSLIGHLTGRWVQLGPTCETFLHGPMILHGNTAMNNAQCHKWMIWAVPQKGPTSAEGETDLPITIPKHTFEVAPWHEWQFQTTWGVPHQSLIQSDCTSLFALGSEFR